MIGEEAYVLVEIYLDGTIQVKKLEVTDEVRQQAEEEGLSVESILYDLYSRSDATTLILSVDEARNLSKSLMEVIK